VLALVRQAQQEDPSLRPAALASLVNDKYGITVHPRSIERALTRSQKNCVERKDAPLYSPAGVRGLGMTIAQ